MTITIVVFIVIIIIIITITIIVTTVVDVIIIVIVIITVPSQEIFNEICLTSFLQQNFLDNTSSFLHFYFSFVCQLQKVKDA